MVGASISEKTDMGRWLTLGFVGVVSLTTVVSLVYIYALPPASMKHDRNGVAHFTPAVLNPETGEPLDMSELVRHFMGD